jgi:hypothetical protein
MRSVSTERKTKSGESLCGVLLSMSFHYLSVCACLMRAAPPYNKTAVIYNTIRVVVVVVGGGGGGGGKRRKKWSERARRPLQRKWPRRYFLWAPARAPPRILFCGFLKRTYAARGRLYVYTSEARTEYGIFLSDGEKSWTTHTRTQRAHRCSSHFFKPCFAFVFVWPPRASTKGRKRERDEAHAAGVSCCSILT